MLLRRFLRNTKMFQCFLSSGGSALSLLEPEILPEDLRLTVSVLDEHYVADPNGEILRG